MKQSLAPKLLKELNTKKQEMELELVKSLDTSFNANEVRFALDNFDKLMSKFEVPNQHLTEETG